METSEQRPTFYKRLAAGAQTISPILHASSDEQIVEQLRAHRLSVDRDSLREWCLKAGSAEEVTLGLIGPELRPKLKDGTLAWIWSAIRVLWKRWFPESPSFEMLNDRIAAGYDAELAAGP